MNKVEKIVNWGATLFIPILLFFLAPIWDSLFDEKKAIEYSIVSERKVFDKEEFKDDWPEFQFNHGESELNEAFLTTIRVSNSGKAPVRTNDFEGPIKFEIELEKGSIKPRVSNSYPKDLPVNIEVDGAGFSIDPMLLNPGDTFYVELLTESRIIINKAVARVVGMDSIKEKEMERYSGLMLVLVEPGDTISSTIQRSLLPVASYSLVVISLLTALCMFLFFFAFQASRSKPVSIMFFTFSMVMYTISILSSRFIPEAFLGSSTERWMDYVCMLGVLLFGAALAFLIRKKLGVIRLRVTSA